MKKKKFKRKKNHKSNKNMRQEKEVSLVANLQRKKNIHLKKSITTGRKPSKLPSVHLRFVRVSREDEMIFDKNFSVTTQFVTQMDNT